MISQEIVPTFLACLSINYISPEIVPDMSVCFTNINCYYLYFVFCLNDHKEFQYEKRNIISSVINYTKTWGMGKGGGVIRSSKLKNLMPQKY